MTIIAICAIIGSLDLVFNNRLGIGYMFKEGILCLGENVLSMVGIITAMPLFTKLIHPLALFCEKVLRIDPAFLGSFFANNMGGYQLSVALAKDPTLGFLSGLVISSMLGATLVYSIPVGIGMIEKDKHEPFLKGLIIGIIFIPVGYIVAGLLIKIKLVVILINTLPIMIIILLIAVCFYFNKNKLLKIFMIIAKILRTVAIIALGISAFQYISGIIIIPQIDNVMNGMQIVSEMGIIQLGAFSMAAIISKFLDKQINFFVKISGFSKNCLISLFMCLINANTVFNNMNKMDDDEVIICSSFICSSICALTAHLSFTASINLNMIFVVIIAKLVSGISAVIVSYFLFKK